MSWSLDTLEQKLKAFDTEPSVEQRHVPAPAISATATAGLPPPAAGESTAGAGASPSGSSDAENAATKQAQQRQLPRSQATKKISKGVLRLYQDSALRQTKLKQQRKKPPPGCTFSPSVNKTRTPRSKSGNNSSKRFDRLYASAREQQARKAKMLKDAASNPAGCTFKPKVIARGRTSERGRDRFNKLYDSAAKTRAKLQRQREQAARQVGTFKPKITKKGRRSASPSPAARFEKLYQDGRRDLDSQRAKQRADREMAECTFKPKINRRSRSSSARRSRSDNAGRQSDNFADRLLAYGKRAEERLARKRTQQEEAAQRQNTFQPRTRHRRHSQDASAGKSARQVAQAAAERLSNTESREERDARLAKRQKELARQKGINFRPRVNKYRRPASARRSRDSEHPEASIWDRLHNNSKEMNSQQKQYLRERQRRELAQCTFKPNIKRMAANVSAAAGEAAAPSQKAEPVWERLSKNKNGQITLRNDIKKNQELEQCTFKPKIHHNPLYASVQVQQKKVWERLHEEKKDFEQLEKDRQQRELDECTFVPEVTEASKQIAQDNVTDTPIWERLHEPDHANKRAAEREKLHTQIELEECTFNPHLEASSQDHINSLFGQPEHDASNIAERLYSHQTSSSRRRSGSKQFETESDTG